VVGCGILDVFLKQGYTVVTASRNAEPLQKLADKYASYADKLVLLHGDIGEPQGAAKIVETVKARFGRVHHVVASLGSWWQVRYLPRSL